MSEINFLLYQTFNQRSYYGKVSELKNLDIKINEILFNNEKYKIKYIIGDNLNCNTFIELKNYNFVKNFDKLKNVFRIQKPIVKIGKVESTCN
jgi:hypothetical protein